MSASHADRGAADAVGASDPVAEVADPVASAPDGAKRAADPVAGATGAARRLASDTRRVYRRRESVRGMLVALAWAGATAAAVLLLDAGWALPPGLLGAAIAAPFLVLTFVAGAQVARVVRRRPLAAYARLADERSGLGERLATAFSAPPDSAVARAFATDAEARIAAVDAADLVPWRIARAGAAALLAIALAGSVLAARGGPAALARGWRAADDDARRRAGAEAGRTGGVAATVGAIAALRWEATPPAYAGASPVRGSGSEAVRALEGSAVRVRVDVRGSGRLAARVIGGEATEIADARRPAWRLAAGNRALLLELHHGDSVVDRRLLALAPVRDDPPRVELAAPERDMTLAEARGALEVRAEAVDDIGVGALELRWIRSRGGGESYSFDEGTLPWTATDRAGTRASASTRLALAALDLGPGDVLHLRAVARDTRALAGGPGEGVSETRTIRIAREDEDALVDAVLTLPARAEENPILSQRMLILLTERLIAEAPPPEALSAGAEEIAEQQARLRGRVGEVIFSRVGDGSEDAPADPFAPAEDVFGGDPARDEHDLEEGFDPLDPEDVLAAADRATGTGDEEELEHRHDEGAVLSVNRDLLAAYNAMWEAERHLRQAAADASLPPQHRALDLLQKIRSGERVFARGRVAVPPVDVAAARGSGELAGVRPGTRAAAPAAGARATLAAALEGLVRRWAEMAPDAAALAASDIAVRLYEDPALDPRAGALVGRAGDAARAGSRAEGRELLGAALRMISPPAEGGGAPIPAPGGGAAYFRALADAERTPAAAAPAPAGTFVFATARYASGDWDSAPLVPANLTHSVAQYTDIPVAADPVEVDLGSPEVFRYPFLFLTGHLPVRFTAAESANLRAWVERGGLIFIDDHNHDIDAAFHRSVVAEIERIFGAGALVDLPNDHELYRAFFRFPDGPPTTAHELNGWGDGLVHERLRAVMVGGRIGVLYSNKDYASQWSYLARNKRFNAVDDTRFGVNVIVYALTR